MFTFFKKPVQGKEITLTIQGMHCTSCALNIDGVLEDVEGVFRAETSYAQAKVKIHFDPTKTTKEKLITIIANEGYKVTN